MGVELLGAGSRRCVWFRVIGGGWVGGVVGGGGGGGGCVTVPHYLLDLIK